MQMVGCGHHIPARVADGGVFPVEQSGNLFVLNKDTKSEDLFEGFNFFIKNGDAGIISESGMPAIADPGSLLVSMAHENNIVVKPLIGPSSVFLALSASGLNGQNFRFLGYLTNKSHLLRKEIKSIERVSRERNETQIFIETPYRNVSLLENLIRFCNPDTLLTVATEITGENEVIKTMPIKDWRNADLKAFHKRNTIFLLLSK